MIGKTVSHYRIIAPLGSGGMGVVYAGEDVRLGRPVALKFVPDELATDEQAVERLMGEARTASGLNHPNICTVYDIGEYEGQPFIVMELLKGQTLRDKLTNGPLRIHEAVDLGIQAADALDAAHHRDIVHRDIKPANLFLVDRGPIKVLDFGLAKLGSRGTAAATTAGLTRQLTAEGITLGTVSYMSPEQVTGEELDGRTDLFSLGVVLYEALTGQQPFTGKTSAVVFSAILTRAPVAPVTFNPELPLRLQDVVNNCLEKDRELRYQDAAGLRADLKRVRRDLDSGRSGVYKVDASSSVDAQKNPGSGSRPMPTEQPAVRSAPVATPQTATQERARPSAARAAAAAIIAAVTIGGIYVWPRSTAPTPTTATSDAASSAGFVRTRLALATTSIESKDYANALKYAEEVLRVAPDNGDAIAIRDAARAAVARVDNPAGKTIAETTRADAPRSASATAPTPRDRAGTEPVRATASRSQPTTAAAASPAPPPSLAPASPPGAVPPPAPAPPKEPVDARAATPPATAKTAPPPPVAQPADPPAPAAAPERHDPGAAPARPAETDDAVIRRVVATYARAIETKDLALFRSVKPNLSADEQRRIEEGFRAVTSQRVAVTVVSIDHRGQQASVRVSRQDTIQAGGRTQMSDSMQTMTVARTAAGGWVIVEIGR